MLNYKLGIKTFVYTKHYHLHQDDDDDFNNTSPNIIRYNIHQWLNFYLIDNNNK